jgi:hypothetical protein
LRQLADGGLIKIVELEQRMTLGMAETAAAVLTLE